MPSTTSGIFELNAGTAIAAGDVLPFVDISDPTQAPQGSLLKITITNFFKLVPVTATFGATALPVGVSGLFTLDNVFGVTPDVATNVLRGSKLIIMGYGRGAAFVGAHAEGTVTAPTALVTNSTIVQVAGLGYDGTAWSGIRARVEGVTDENWTVGAHGSSVRFSTTAVGATSLVVSLVLRNVANATQLVPAATSISFRNNANNANNLIILDAGAATFRTSITATTTITAGTGLTVTTGATTFGGSTTVTADYFRVTSAAQGVPTTGASIVTYYDGTNFNIAAKSDWSGGTVNAPLVLTGSTVNFPTVGTTGSAANAYLDNGSNNSLLRSTSSLRYKDDLKAIGVDEARALVRGFRDTLIDYRSTAKADKARRFVGMGAERVADVDRRFVHFDPEGQPDGVMYDRMVVPLLALVEHLDRQVAALTSLPPAPAHA